MEMETAYLVEGEPGRYYLADIEGFTLTGAPKKQKRKRDQIAYLKEWAAENGFEIRDYPFEVAILRRGR